MPHNIVKTIRKNNESEDSGTMGRRRMLQLAGISAVAASVPSFVCTTALAAEKTLPASAFWEKAGMDVMTAIFTRRSERDFTGAAIPRDELYRIIAAGMNAPSSHNAQPWRFVVITGQERLRQIYNINPYAEYAVRAGAAVLICVQEIPGEELELGILSATCCAQNMLLAGHALGYGGVWIQIYPEEADMDDWRKHVKLPKDCLPLCLLTMGKTRTSLPPVNRFDATKIYWQTWQGKE